MNKLCFLAFFVLSVLTISSTGCRNSKKSFIPQTTSIDGEISQIGNPPIVIFTGKNDEIYKSDQITKTTTTKFNFAFKNKLSDAGIYSISFDTITQYFYLEPGDHVSIKFFDTQSIQLISKHTYENNFLKDFLNYKNELIADSLDQVFALPEIEFIKKIEEYTQYLVNFQQEYQKKHEPFNEIFADLIIDEIAFDAAIKKLSYPTKHKIMQPDSVLALSDTYDTFLQNMDIDDEQMLLVPSFRDFLQLYIDFYVQLNRDKAPEEVKTEKQPLIKEQFDFIGKTFNNPYIKNYLYYQFMLLSLPHGGIEYLDVYMSVQKDNYYIDVINARKELIK